MGALPECLHVHYMCEVPEEASRSSEPGSYGRASKALNHGAFSNPSRPALLKLRKGQELDQSSVAKPKPTYNQFLT